MKRKMYEGDVSHILSLTTRQKTELNNAYSNQLATDILLRKAQIFKIIQSIFLSLLSKFAHTIMKIAALLAKHILLPLALAATASAANAGTQKWIHDSGCPGMLARQFLDLTQQTTTLITSNEEMEDNKISQIPPRLVY